MHRFISGLYILLHWSMCLFPWLPCPRSSNLPLFKPLTSLLRYRKEKKVKSLSRVQLFVTPWTVAYQATPSMEFSRQEYWSGLPFPSPGDLPHPGIKLRSPALQGDSLPSEPQTIRGVPNFFLKYLLLPPEHPSLPLYPIWHSKD